MAAADPSPGTTPTSVPSNTPRKQYARFMGSSDTENPSTRLSRMLMRTSERQQARGKRQTEPYEPGIGGDGADNGAYRRAGPGHGADTPQEQKQQRYRAQHEPDPRQGPGVDGQGCDHDPYAPV